MKYVNAATTAEKISDKFNIPMAELVDVFAEIPAEDVQPIQHGKWIGVDYDTYFECSECKHMTDWQLYKYCPYCGAKMIKDGEQNDD